MGRLLGALREGYPKVWAAVNLLREARPVVGSPTGRYVVFVGRVATAALLDVVLDAVGVRAFPFVGEMTVFDRELALGT